MNTNVRRRDILRLLGVGGVVFASGLGLAGCGHRIIKLAGGRPLATEVPFRRV